MLLSIVWLSCLVPRLRNRHPTCYLIRLLCGMLASWLLVTPAWAAKADPMATTAAPPCHSQTGSHNAVAAHQADPERGNATGVAIGMATEALPLKAAGPAATHRQHQHSCCPQRCDCPSMTCSSASAMSPAPFQLRQPLLGEEPVSAGSIHYRSQLAGVPFKPPISA